MTDAHPPQPGRRRRNHLRHIRLIVGLGLSALLFWLAYRHVGGKEVWRRLHDRPIHFGILIGVALLDTGVLALRAVKWHLILRPIRRVPVFNTFSAAAIGVMTNNLLPFRIDEVVRSYILGRRERLPTAVVFGTVTVERSADIGVLLLAVVMATVLMPMPPELVGAAPWVGAALGTAAAVLVVAALAGEHIAERVRRFDGRRGRAWAARAAAACEGFARAVRAFPRGWRLPAVFALTLAEMTLSAVVAWLTATALGLHIPRAPTQALVVVVLGGYASFAVPSSPGSIGLYEWLNAHALTSLYGVKEADAGAFVLLLHAVLIVPSSLIGLACLWRERVGFGRLVREGMKAPPGREDHA